MISESQIIKNEIDKLNILKAKRLIIFPLLNKAKIIFIQNGFGWITNFIMAGSVFIIISIIFFVVNRELAEDINQLLGLLLFAFLFFGWIIAFIFMCLINFAVTPLLILIFMLRRFIYYFKIKGLIQKYLSIKLNEYQSQGYDISELEDIKELIK